MVSLLNRPEYYNNPYKGEEYTGTNFLGNPNFPQYSALKAGQNYYSALPKYQGKAYGMNTPKVVTKPVQKGFSSLGSQMASTGQMGSANKTAKTKPNFKNSLLNYLDSSQGRGMARGLLEASGYSDTPVSFGQALAQGMTRSDEAVATDRANELAKLQMEIERAKIKPQETFTQQMIEVPDGKGGTTTVPVNASDLT